MVDITRKLNFDSDMQESFKENCHSFTTSLSWVLSEVFLVSQGEQIELFIGLTCLPRLC